MARIPVGLKFLLDNAKFTRTEMEIIEKFVGTISGTENIENMFSPMSRWMLVDQILATSSEDMGYPIDKSGVIQSMSSLSDVEPIVTRWFQNSVDAKILYRLTDSQYYFVVPEVGFWLISKYLCDVNTDTSLSLLDKLIRSGYARHPFTKFFMEYVLWNNVQSFL